MREYIVDRNLTTVPNVAKASIIIQYLRNIKEYIQGRSLTTAHFVGRVSVGQQT
jgi:hypothetical protein